MQVGILRDQIQTYCSSFADEEQLFEDVQGKRDYLYALLLDANWISEHKDLAARLIQIVEETNLPYEKAIEISYTAAHILTQKVNLILKSGWQERWFTVTKLVLASLMPGFSGSVLHYEVEMEVLQVLVHETSLSKVRLADFGSLIGLAQLLDKRELVKMAQSYFLEATKLAIQVKEGYTVELTLAETAAQVFLQGLPDLWKIHLTPQFSSEQEPILQLCSAYGERIISIDFSAFAEIEDHSIQAVFAACPNLCEVTIASKKATNEAFKNLGALKNLARLILRCSQITVLEIGLANLVYLKLEGSIGLEILNFHTPSNLVDLYLSCCRNLKRVTGISALTKLQHLDLFECHGHECLDFSPLINLASLDISGCNQYETIPLAALINLVSLKLSACLGLRALTDLKYLSQLRELDISRCTNLTEAKIKALSHLLWLNMSGCTALRDFSEVSYLVKLVYLNLSGCFEKGELPDLSQLQSLAEFDISDCRVQKVILRNPLTKVNMSGCDAVEEVEFYGLNTAQLDLQCLKKLRKLKLDALHKLVTLQLPHLVEVEIKDLNNIEQVELANSGGDLSLFLAKFPKKVAQMAFLQEIHVLLQKKEFLKAGDLFFTLQGKKDYLEFLNLVVAKFRDICDFLINSYPEEIAQSIPVDLPFNTQLNLLPLLPPSRIEFVFFKVQSEWRTKWLQEEMGALQEKKEGIEKHYNRKWVEELNRIPFRVFAVLAFEPEALFIFLPHLNETRRAVSVPLMPAPFLIEFLLTQPLASHVDYLPYATPFQKEKYLEGLPAFSAIKTSADAVNFRHCVIQTLAILDRIKRRLLLHDRGEELKTKIEQTMETITQNLTLPTVTEEKEEPFLDIVTGERLSDPYKDEKGRTLNKSTWRTLKDKNLRNPFDRSIIELDTLVPHKELKQLMAEFLDPFSKRLMSNPYQDKNGKNLDRSTWEKLHASGQKNPFDQTPVDLAALQPNGALKERIGVWRRTKKKEIDFTE